MFVRVHYLKLNTDDSITYCIIGDSGHECLISVSNVTRIMTGSKSIIEHLTAENIRLLISLKVVHILELIVGDCTTGVEGASFQENIGCSCRLACNALFTEPRDVPSMPPMC